MTDAIQKQADHVAVVNSPAVSKINIASFASLLLAIAAAAGIAIPEEWREVVSQVVSLVTPVVILILRTWFTSHVASSGVLRQALSDKVIEDAAARFPYANKGQ